MKRLFYTCLILLIAGCNQQIDQPRAAITEVMQSAVDDYHYSGFDILDTISYIDGTREWFLINHQYTSYEIDGSVELELIVFPGKQAFVNMPGESDIPYPAGYIN